MVVVLPLAMPLSSGYSGSQLLPWILQVQLDPELNDGSIVERIDELLSVQTDPMDLRTCAFGS